ncbi:hypothetical protein Lser_V15G03053 [Lactuca serriola]
MVELCQDENAEDHGANSVVGRRWVKVFDDSRTDVHKMAESFVNKFFPSGFPYRPNLHKQLQLVGY